MKCAWDKLLKILPIRFRQEVDGQGSEAIQEIRLRMNSPPELVLESGSRWLNAMVEKEDLSYVINAASQYSPWSAVTVSQGFLTAPGGHRIGICGEIVVRNGVVYGYQQIRSVCIRIARDFSGITDGITDLEGSVLIIGPPGWGKTTLLRDLIRQIGRKREICVVDERREIFPEGFCQGRKVDVLYGCSKTAGIEMLLRTMGPQVIAVDEITAQEDCHTIIHAMHCGVSFLATAHARSVKDLKERSIYRSVLGQGKFENVLVLNRDKTYEVERVTI